MTGLNHVLTGSAIALAVRQPLLIVPLAVLSHFILDALPHYGSRQYLWGSRFFVPIMATDGVFSVGSVIAIMLAAPQFAGLVALGAFCAYLPDVFWLYYYQHGEPQWWFYRFHTKIQWFERPPGAFVEIAYAVFITTVIVTTIT